MSFLEKLLIIITWILLVFPLFVLSEYCIKPFFSSPISSELSPFGLILLLIFTIFITLSFISHLQCWLSDPGRTPKLPQIDKNTFCATCKQHKPKRSHHCKSCNFCVHRLDHHCVWVNNCVGGLNQKYFILFLFYTAASSGIALIIIACTLYNIYGTEIKGVDFLGVFLVTSVAIESLIFMIFTGDFLVEQLESVRDNQTCVESYQFKRGVEQDVKKNFENVFGKTHRFWMFPVYPDITVDYLEDIVVERDSSDKRHRE